MPCDLWSQCFRQALKLGFALLYFSLVRGDPCKESPKHTAPLPVLKFYCSATLICLVFPPFLALLLWLTLSFVWDLTWAMVLWCYVIRRVALEPMVLQKCFFSFMASFGMSFYPDIMHIISLQYHLLRYLRCYPTSNISMHVKSVDNSPSPQSICVISAPLSEMLRETSGFSLGFWDTQGLWD